MSGTISIRRSMRGRMSGVRALNSQSELVGREHEIWPLLLLLLNRLSRLPLTEVRCRTRRRWGKGRSYASVSTYNEPASGVSERVADEE